MKLALVSLLFVSNLAWLAMFPRPNVDYKLTQQNNRYEIGVTCTNGGDPTVAGNFDGMLMVSCGAE